MTTRDEQDVRYWLTTAGCSTTGGHRPDLDGRHCRVCGARLDEVPC